MANDLPVRVSPKTSDADVVFLDPAAFDDSEVFAEIRDWASLNAPEDAAHRGPLDMLLTIDGLMAAAGTGVLGNAAWSLFPAAARWMRDRHGDERALAAHEALERIRECMRQIDPDAAGLLRVESLRRTDEGGWLVRLDAGHKSYEVTATRSGEIVRVRRRR